MMENNIPISTLESRPDLEERIIISPIEQLEKINEREGGLFEAYVPLDLINQQDVAVDNAHVLELAESMRNQSKIHGTGQLSPVLLGLYLGQEKYEIIDGFHRIPAIKLAGSEFVYATIKPDCTREDIIDLRIVSASSHNKVKFSRIIEWVKEAWETTPWANNINVYSAFIINVINNRGTGHWKDGNELNDEDVRDIKEWVQRKCEQWDINPRFVGQYLKTAHAADPELVKVARERTSAKKLEVITPSHLD